MHLTRVLSDTLELFAPSACLVCSAPLRDRPICRRCLPPLALDLHAPPRCVRCFSRVMGLHSDGLCGMCRMVPLVFDRIRYLWEYEGLARAVIHSAKYRPSERLCGWLGRQLALHGSSTFGALQDWDMVVPVATSRRALARRGFSVATTLSRHVAKKLALPSSPLLLRHRGTRSAQAWLKPMHRIPNVRKAFQAPARAQNLRVLLIDDVLTTGATATAAALALLDAGADSVDLLCVARSVAWGNYRQAVYRKMAR